MLRLSFITGTEPDKWFKRFQQRTNYQRLVTIPADDSFALLAQDSTLALTRLPDSRIDDSYHVVGLYNEAPGIAFPKDSYLAASTKDLVEQDFSEEKILWAPPDSGEIDVSAVRDALQLVAANIGVVIAPQPLLKVLAKKQIDHRGLSDGTPTTIALVWAKSSDNEEIQDFVGIAKGRKENSNRQNSVRKSAREKTLAKQRRRKALQQQPGKIKRPRRSH